MSIDRYEAERVLEVPPERDPLAERLAEQGARVLHEVSPGARSARRTRRMMIAIAFSILAAMAAGLAAPAFGHEVWRLVGLGKPTPSETARSLETDWRERLADGARSDPAKEFDNLPRDVFLARVRDASARYGFTIEEVEFVRPVEDAPLLVVRTANPGLLARRTPQLLREVGPRVGGGEDTDGWAYEGFFFVAKDEGGVPFLIVHNSWRGHSAGGGQWAADEDLYPFPRL